MEMRCALGKMEPAIILQHHIGRLDGEGKSGYTNETRLITIKIPEGALRWAVTALCMRCLVHWHPPPALPGDGYYRVSQ